MNIQGISGSQIEARTFNPGTTLNQIKDSIKNNGLSEVIIKNDDGFHVIHGKNLSFETDYFRHSDGSMVVTNISQPRQLPKEGARVSFGDIQGELVMADSVGGTSRFDKVIEYSVKGGAAIAGAIGFSAVADNTRHAGIDQIVAGLFGGAFAAGIGAGVGLAVGAVINVVLDQKQTDDSSLKAISKPAQ